MDNIFVNFLMWWVAGWLVTVGVVELYRVVFSYLYRKLEPDWPGSSIPLRRWEYWVRCFAFWPVSLVMAHLAVVIISIPFLYETYYKIKLTREYRKKFPDRKI